MTEGSPSSLSRAWVPYVVSSTGAVLGGLLLLEVLVIQTGLGAVYDGFWIGVATSTPFILGLILGGYWLLRSDRPTRDSPRILWWFGGIATGFVLMVTTINGSIRTLTPLLAVGTLRWSAAIGGTLGLVIGVLQTRSVRRAIEADRARRRQRDLERERDRLEEFATEVTHDLRGPLNVAQGQLDMLRSEHDNPRIEKIDTALDRMEPIIENTLALARAGETIGDTEPVELAAIARNSWAAVESDAATLQLEGSAVIEADADRLRHLFENLFRNAIDHVGADVAVRVGLLPESDGFYVEDDGPGIAPDNHDQIFERGSTTAKQGTGVGLGIVERIVDAHGWTVAVAESRDGGARFEIKGVHLRDDTEVDSTLGSEPEDSNRL